MTEPKSGLGERDRIAALLDCPHCGAAAEMVLFGKMRRITAAIVCSGCGARSKPVRRSGKLMDGIRAQWNKRAGVTLREPGAPNGLNLVEFSRTNLARCTSPDGFGHPLNSWSVAEWTNAVAGEAGEACNFAKKLLRHRDGTRGNYKEGDKDVEALKRKAAGELADVVIYADLAAAALGYDLATVLAETFNAKSDELKLPYRIAASAPLPDTEGNPRCEVCGEPGGFGGWSAQGHAHGSAAPLGERNTPEPDDEATTLEQQRPGCPDCAPCGVGWATQCDHGVALTIPCRACRTGPAPQPPKCRTCLGHREVWRNAAKVPCPECAGSPLETRTELGSGERERINERLRKHFHGGPAYDSCAASQDIQRLLDIIDTLRGVSPTPEVRPTTPTEGIQEEGV